MLRLYDTCHWITTNRASEIFTLYLLFITVSHAIEFIELTVIFRIPDTDTDMESFVLSECTQ